MKSLLSLAVVAVLAVVATPGEKQKAPAFDQFVKIVPQFSDMDKGIAAAKERGVPPICWVSESANASDIFRNDAARQLSFDLRKLTVQVNMKHNPSKDRFDAKGRPLPARLEFSNSLYGKDAKTAYLTLDKIDGESARKVLEFCRGGKDK